jgi:hypothetical protein
MFRHDFFFLLLLGKKTKNGWELCVTLSMSSGAQMQYTTEKHDLPLWCEDVSHGTATARRYRPGHILPPTTPPPSSHALRAPPPPPPLRRRLLLAPPFRRRHVVLFVRVGPRRRGEAQPPRRRAQPLPAAARAQPGQWAMPPSTFPPASAPLRGIPPSTLQSRTHFMLLRSSIRRIHWFCRVVPENLVGYVVQIYCQFFFL